MMKINKKTKNRLKYITFAFFLLPIIFSSRSYGLEIHQNIKGPFPSGKEVTVSCLKCHKQHALEVLQSTHWTWVRQRTVNGKDILFGKKDSLTGFAIDVSSNPSRCMRCHISNTRPDINFNKPVPEMVDCLVCHDTTGRYIKMDPGYPENLNSETLEFMAQNVGIPTPMNCLTCHFADCGLPANNLSGTENKKKASSLSDIHMDSTATSLMCQDCHVKHSGHSFSRKVGKKNGSESVQGCAHCHGSTPHVLEQLNQHVSSVACQTCHIPQYALQNPQFFSWNWIMSGKANRIYTTSSNTRILAQDENGFSLATMIEPVYLWDDGGDNVYTRGQRVKPQELTYLQKPSEKSINSKIAPFRVIYGTQMYDSKYRYLISPLLQPSGSSLFPGSDWNSIAKKGMEAIVLPFSGEYAFVPTATYRRINHGVVSAEGSLGCIDCHGSSSRMPWEELGYEKDLWSSNTEINTNGESKANKTKPSAAMHLQPAKDSIIPSFSRF